MLSRGNRESYAAVCAAFEWRIPEVYNIGVDICDRQAARGRERALVVEKDDGKIETYTFRDLQRLSNRLANTLQAFGMTPGDRVGILLPQCLETALAHIAKSRTASSSTRRSPWPPWSAARTKSAPRW